MRKIREIAAILLALGLFAGIAYFAGRVLLPKRTVYGATWGMFRQEEEDSLDVLYFGSSIAYCDIVPAVVWKESGLTSYVLAGPAQTMPVTYYYVREACKTQSPQAVVVELNGLFFDQYPELMKPNLLYMPSGMNRVQATLNGANPADRLEILFPLYGTHERVYSITADEVKWNLHPPKDDMAGYTLLTDIKPISEPLERAFDVDTDNYRLGIQYLRRISDFCAERGIRLVLYFAPLCCNIPQHTLDVLYQDVAGIPHDSFFDCNTGDWPALDPMTSWFDGLHLNVYGAVPFSVRFAQELKELGLESTHDNGALWQERYNALRERSPAALEGIT